MESSRCEWKDNRKNEILAILLFNQIKAKKRSGLPFYFGWGGHFFWSYNRLYWDIRTGSNGNRLSTPLSFDVPFVICMYNSLSEERRGIWINGDLKTAISAAKSSIFNGAFYFPDQSGSSEEWGSDCLLGEIMVFRGALPDVKRQRIEGYLSHKWGLANQLPTDHYYSDEKNIPESDLFFEVDGNEPSVPSQSMIMKWNPIYQSLFVQQTRRAIL